MQTGGAYFVDCLKKIQRFFSIDTFQIVISIYKRIVRNFFRKIYGREINGINQGSYLKYNTKCQLLQFENYIMLTLNIIIILSEFI